MERDEQFTHINSADPKPINSTLPPVRSNSLQSNRATYDCTIRIRRRKIGSEEGIGSRIGE